MPNKIDERLLGARKDKFSPKDDAFIYKPKMRLVPEDIGVGNQYLPATGDQDPWGSCVGASEAGYLTSIAMQLGLDPEWFSIWWFYNWARAVQGDLMTDAGAYPRDAYDMTLKYGCLKEHLWPYTPNKFDTQAPPSRLWPEAAKWPILSFHRIDNGADGIMAAFADMQAEGRPIGVTMATPWPDKWMDTKDGVLSIPKQSWRVVGGHQYWYYRSNKKDGYFQGMNTWGEDVWSYTGKVVPKGHFRMPMEVCDWAKRYWDGYDCYCVKVRWATVQPEPTPGPVVAGQYKVSGFIPGTIEVAPV